MYILSSILFFISALLILFQKICVRIVKSDGFKIELELFPITVVFTNKKEKDEQKKKHGESKPAKRGILKTVFRILSRSDVTLYRLVVPTESNNSAAYTGAVIYPALSYASSYAKSLTLKDGAIYVTSDDAASFFIDISVGMRLFRLLYELIVYYISTNKRRLENGKKRKRADKGIS